LSRHSVDGSYPATIITSGQRILTKGRVAEGGQNFARRKFNARATDCVSGRSIETLVGGVNPDIIHPKVPLSIYMTTVPQNAWDGGKA